MLGANPNPHNAMKGCETMPDREKVISEIVERIEATLAVNTDYVNVPLDLLQYALTMLKKDEEVEMCERCGRIRLKSKWDRR